MVDVRLKPRTSQGLDTREAREIDLGSVRAYEYSLPVIGAILAIGGCAAIHAQEVRLPVVVVQIAGQNVYLNVGSEAGLVTGDSLAVYRSDTRLGGWTVVSVARSSALVTARGSPFAVTLGDSLRISFAGRAARTEKPLLPSVSDSTISRQRRLMETSSPRRRAHDAAAGVAVHGGMTLGFHAMRSSTTSAPPGASTVVRTYRSPSVTIRSVADGLPLGFRAFVNTRLAYRSASPSRIELERTFRIYQLGLERDLADAPVHVQLGRFANRAESFSGFWDGAALSYGAGSLRMGMAAGLQPDRGVESLSASLPKYTFFAGYDVENGELRYTADASVHEVRPTERLPVHTYVGLSQALRWRSYRLRSITQLDRDPGTQAWVFTRIQLYGSIPLGTRLLARMRYGRRQPYQLWRVEEVIGTRRDIAGAGLTWRLGSGQVTMDATSNRDDRNGRSYATSSDVRFWNVGVARIGLSASLGIWSREGQSAWYLAPAVDRVFRRGRALLRYRFDGSRIADYRSDLHALEAVLNVPVSRRIDIGLFLGAEKAARIVRRRVFSTVRIRW